VPHPLKSEGEKCLVVSTQPRITRFRSNCVQSLNTWYPKCC